MREIWYAIPTARRDIAGACFAKWQERGYRTAALIDGYRGFVPHADLTIRVREYKGYAQAVNKLCRAIVRNYSPDIIITGGEDVWPDPLHPAHQIAKDFYTRFPSGFGVMQPTGDEYGSIHACCPSPWMGRGWIERAYGGNGPLWHEYFHFFVDEELRCVAEKLGVFEARKTIVQYHKPWERGAKQERPMHLQKANALWIEGKTLFHDRKAKGFPGHEPIK
jgi:hypothetical protein